MIIKLITFGLCCALLLSVNFSFAAAQSLTGNDKAAAKIKADVLKRGTGKKIKVKMLDGQKLSDTIDGIGADSFSLTDSKTKQTTSIAYSNVDEVKGTGFPLGAKIGIIAAAAGAVAVTLILARYCSNEGGC